MTTSPARQREKPGKAEEKSLYNPCERADPDSRFLQAHSLVETGRRFVLFNPPVVCRVCNQVKIFK